MFCFYDFDLNKKDTLEIIATGNVFLQAKLSTGQC
jgi:hypothetical protein